MINYEGFPYLFSFDFILLSVKLFPGRFLIFLNSASNTFGWYFQEIKKSVFNSSNLFSNILMQIRINIKATYIYFFTVKLQYNHKDIKYGNLQQLVLVHNRVSPSQYARVAHRGHFLFSLGCTKKKSFFLFLDQSSFFHELFSESTYLCEGDY